MYLNLHLNARFQPISRHALEDALHEILQKNHGGEVNGGGTEISPDGEPLSCDIELLFLEDAGSIPWLVEMIHSLGIAKGSILSGADVEYPVGSLEGLALYLNGTDLPREIYRNADVNDLIARLEGALGVHGRMYSFWEGLRETALYFYGPSFEEMKSCIVPLLTDFPLCRKARMVRIA